MMVDAHSVGCRVGRRLQMMVVAPLVVRVEVLKMMGVNMRIMRINALSIRGRGKMLMVVVRRRRTGRSPCGSSSW